MKGYGFSKRIACICTAILTIMSVDGNSVSAETEIFPMTWQKEPGLRVGLPDIAGVLAPDVQLMDDGTYRMYFTVTGRGVGSAVSSDGFAWALENDLRIVSLRNTSDYVKGNVGFDLGHPWLVRLSDGRWRMYLQANTGLHTPLQIQSAVSDDGVTFTLEDGLRVAIGAQSGPLALSFAGHGRAWAQPDGTWAMFFSGNLLHDRSPSDIMLATSIDGLTWQVVNPNVYTDGHDPTVIRLSDGRLAVVYAYLKESLQAGFSEDGLTWTKSQPLTLLDEHGQRMSEIFGDVALMRLPDGTLRMLSNDRDGITSFVPVQTDMKEE